MKNIYILYNIIIKLFSLFFLNKKKCNSFLDKNIIFIYKQRNKKIKNNVKNLQKNIFLHTTNTSNLGDIYSSPASYFTFKNKVKQEDIVKYINNHLSIKNICVIGGGALGLIAKESKVYKKFKNKNNIGWGFGLDYDVILNKDFKKKFKFIGIRTYNHKSIDNKKVFYVPCASCMSSLFDKQYKIKNQIGFYFHARKKLDKQFEKSIKDYPKLNNYHYNLSEAIQFIGEHEYIITNSYHGAYWGMLLGRKVICLGDNHKVKQLKYKVPIANINDWKEKIKEAKAYPEYIKDCREKNISFYNKLKDI